MDDDAEARFPPFGKEVPGKTKCDLEVLNEWDAALYNCKGEAPSEVTFVATVGQTCTEACEQRSMQCDEGALKEGLSASGISALAQAAGSPCEGTQPWAYPGTPAICTDTLCCGDGSCTGLCSFGDKGGSTCEAEPAAHYSRLCHCVALPEAQQAWVGCYVDDASRMFHRGPHQYGYTGETCASECRQISATYFSLQNGGWCACGNQDDFGRKTVYTQAPDADCRQIEDRFGGYRGGGPWRNAVYRVSQAPAHLP